MSGQASLDNFAVPAWMTGYTEPVVRVPQSTTKKFHKPDTDAAEPSPECTINYGHAYDVKERAVIEGFWSPCNDCYGEDEE